MSKQQLLSSFLVGGKKGNSSADTDCSQLSVSTSDSDLGGGDTELDIVFDAAAEDSDGDTGVDSEDAACGYSVPLSSGPVAKKAKSSASSHQRKSGFDPSWKKQHPWVVYNREEHAMYCQLCIAYKKLPKNGSGKWVTVGTTTFRQEKLAKHECTVMHRDAESCKHQEVQSHVSGGIRAALEVGVTRQRKAVIGALKCLYFLAKNELPHTTNFSSLLDLAISLGCDYMRELRQGSNASYRSEQTIAEFLFSLYDCIKQNVMASMHESSTISIMVDESTDVAVFKQLVVYGRGVMGGKLECHFLGIRDLPDGRAVTIEKSLSEFLQDINFDVNDISSFGSDGANVMTGRKQGVATLLKRINNNIISIHCVAHRLALATSQASESITYLRRFKEILSSLFYFYHNSPVRQAGLTAIQTVLGDPVLRLKQAKDVRWLSHQAAIDALRRSLLSVLISLDREASERGEHHYIW